MTKIPADSPTYYLLHDMLLEAAEYGDEAQVWRALTRGVDVDEPRPDAYQHTALILACDSEHEYIVELLLAAGANPQQHALDRRGEKIYPTEITYSDSTQHLLDNATQGKRPVLEDVLEKLNIPYTPEEIAKVKEGNIYAHVREDDAPPRPKSSPPPAISSVFKNTQLETALQELSRPLTTKESGRYAPILLDGDGVQPESLELQMQRKNKDKERG